MLIKSSCYFLLTNGWSKGGEKLEEIQRFNVNDNEWKLFASSWTQDAQRFRTVCFFFFFLEFCSIIIIYPKYLGRVIDLKLPK